MNELEELERLDITFSASAGLAELLARFAFNALVVWVIIHLLYYPKSKRKDYYFTFLLISTSIFFLVFMLGGIKLKIGFALGLFAIFGIIRYRTESMPVREMTYLFVIISVSVINALTHDYLELVVANLLFIGCIAVCESSHWLKQTACKYVEYDRIELIKPTNRKELLNDLKNRTGLNITKIEVGSIDFLKDSALLKIYYTDECEAVNSVDYFLKLPKE